LNNLVWKNLAELTSFCQIIHSAGRGKSRLEISHPRYHQFEILTEGMANALAVADLIVSRAGMGALSEFAALGKPVILIPLPGHQEANAEILKEKNAAVVWKQSEINNERFVAGLKKLLADREKLSSLGQNIHIVIKTDVRAAMSDLIMEIIRH
jgi:UDP-N-acetylglucosamine--N-acetylmuramyl-(pentapeptide) pyrophosphoryl-undecaprenol N-acetylglucosamine transferase